MRNEKKKIAIYSRKSRFSGKGESIANQIEECKNYCYYTLRLKEGDIEFTVYEDEGYSGKNLERPAMKKFLSELEQYDFFVCYRLDRVSRSVSDFSNFIKKLETEGVEFASVSESFDTTKPMGRAMMTITSAFAELERDTITERIVDNMMALAKTGRWLGGMAPLGFMSKKILFERDGKTRSYYKLEMVPEELDKVRLIYEKYLELGSLTKLASYLMNRGIKTQKDVDFSNYSLKFILQNPVYCTADEQAWEYLKENDFSVYAEKEKFDGLHGIIGYNKTNVNKRNGKQRFNDTKDWIIAVGEHEAAVTSSMWIKVQEKLKHQKKFAFRRAKTNSSLLSGLVFCSCGSPMRPKSTGTIRREGMEEERRFSYMCEKKSRSKGGLCSQKNIQGNTLDEYAVSYLFEMYGNVRQEENEITKLIKNELDSSLPGDSEEILLERAIDINRKKLDRLVKSLESAASEEVEVALFQRMEEISQDIKEKQKELEDLHNGKEPPNIAKLKEYLNTLMHFDRKLWKQLDYGTKKDIMELLIERVEWDGVTATVYPAGISLLTEGGVSSSDNLATPDVSTTNFS